MLSDAACSCAPGRSHGAGPAAGGAPHRAARRTGSRGGEPGRQRSADFVPGRVGARDHGFMYGTSFTDPDGTVWETMWMDPSVPQ